MLYSYQPYIQTIFTPSGYSVDILRLDLIDEEVSGNKWFKLKYNLLQASSQGHNHIITFGGAFSNHLAATAAACQKSGLRSTCVIRGEAPAELNATLLKARDKGMQFYFVSREQYRHKEESAFRELLLREFGEHWLIPEGGHNTWGVLGCTGILDAGWDHRHIFCACGTGTTYAGLLASARADQWIHGISVLKGKNTLPAQVCNILGETYPGRVFSVNAGDELSGIHNRNDISNAFAFSGYAGFEPELAAFKCRFEERYGILLDHIYTAKLFYGVFKLLEFADPMETGKVLVIHSGGLQGNAGFEERYQLMPAR